MPRSTTLALCAATATAAVAALASAPLAQATPADTVYALSTGNLAAFSPSAPSQTLRTAAIDGVAASEHLVALTVRPQNGVLYALGVDAAANTGTLYVLGLNGNGGFAGPAAALPVGAVGSIALTTDGTRPVDLPAAGYALAFNPATDRARVTTASGLNFRVDPNTGAPVDGDDGSSPGSVSGTNPDGALHGTSSGAGGLGSTNARLNATTTTIYTLDGAADELALLNPANAGTQTSAVPLTQGGAPFTAGTVGGFALDPDVTTATGGAPATAGDAYAALQQGVTTKLYKIALATGAVTDLGTIGDGTRPIQSLALPRGLQAAGYPAIGLPADGGDTLARFQSATPGTQTTVPVTGLRAGEHLVGLSWRTQTGQLIGVGVDPAADDGTAYRVDPQTGAATAIGAPGGLAWVDGSGRPVDLPATGWGMDVMATFDTLLLIDNPAGLNLRVRLTSGTPIDGDLGGAAGSVPGTNPDHPLNGQPAGADQPMSVTSAYPWPHTTLGSGMEDVAYDLEPVTDRVLLQLGTRTGTFYRNFDKPIAVNGTALDFGPQTATDMPWGKGGSQQTAVMISSLVVGGRPGLYGINPDTGVTDAFGALPTALRALAVGAAEPAAAVPSPPAPPVTRQPAPSGEDTSGPAPDRASPRAAAPTAGASSSLLTAPLPDRTAPRLTGLRVRATATRALRVGFTASEAGKATISLVRETRHGHRTVRVTIRSVTRAIARAGRVSVALRSLPAGRLRVQVTMRDGAGNRARAVARTVTLRGR